mmetsp:Transcript_12081/g.34612  ORF Transcript_12081/g.34612 Transcript_12081/m.34612 type:complete len:251 (+) Transcript_12081:360-1112(+)
MVGRRSPTGTRSDDSSRVAVSWSIWFTNRFEALPRAVRRFHSLLLRMREKTTSSSRERDCRSRLALLLGLSLLPPSLFLAWSFCSSATSSRVVWTARSSWSLVLTSGDVWNNPSGSTKVPKRVRPVGKTPDRTRASVHSDRVLAARILQTCSIRIVCRGVSSSVSTTSRTWSAICSSCWMDAVELLVTAPPAAPVLSVVGVDRTPEAEDAVKSLNPLTSCSIRSGSTRRVSILCLSGPKMNVLRALPMVF